MRYKEGETVYVVRTFHGRKLYEGTSEAEAHFVMRENGGYEKGWSFERYAVVHDQRINDKVLV